MERISAVAPARVCAYKVIRRVFEQGAYADRALHAEAAGLDPRDRALAMALAYGAVQRRATLDHIAAALSSRPAGQIDPPVLAALRLGLLQLLFLDGIAEHAAVNDSVELAKASTGGGGGRENRGVGGFVNAVLRRAIREGRALLDALGDATPAQASIKYSVGEWLAALWFDELGAEEARSLLRVINGPAESALRANTLVATPAQVLERLPVPAHAVPGLEEAIVLDAPFDAHGSELFRSGALMPQSRASMLVSRVLAPAPGERVLDLCAAPGAKTTHLAALMADRGELRAVERNPKRADGLRRTAKRLGATIVEVEVGDATAIGGPLDRAGGYDRVLVDPPCSGLGTLQSRPDLRWRTSPERISELCGLQAEILAAGARATRPGGTLVYSVCTISRAESEGVIESFLATHKDWEPAHPEPVPTEALPLPAAGGRGGFAVQLRPDRDGTDGFWIARLRRAA